MKQTGTMTVSKVGQGTLPKWWRDASGLSTRSLSNELADRHRPVVHVRWKQLLAELKRGNRTMTCEDSLIAATALFHGHTVATHNKRHFEPADVPIIDPLS
jgi:predicted nucleic acid-binding protein